MTNVFKKLLITSLTIFALIVSLAAFSAEVSAIKNFNSKIVVNQDSSQIVTETINIATDGMIVRHGIYRDFPTDYKTKDGKRVRIKFDVQYATLNGMPVYYRTTRLSNGVRVYLGDSNTVLPAGNYTYVINYTTSGQLGFFQDHDELYWNVTGNGWVFPIEKVEASVILPEGALQNITAYTAYTGYFGSRGTDFKSSIAKDYGVIFSTTRPLVKSEGLTIVVGWKKGFVTPPKQELFAVDRLMGLSADVVLFAGLIVLLLYYLIVWFRFGRDPHTIVIIPEYTPPEGFSASALRYILKMRYDIKVLAAAILNLAVKGFLIIEERKKEYSLIKQQNFTDQLSYEDMVIADGLFRNVDFCILNKKGVLEPVFSGHKDNLKLDFAGKYFVNNYIFMLPGLLISILSVFGALYINQFLIFSVFMAVFLAAFVVGIVKVFVPLSVKSIFIGTVQLVFLFAFVMTFFPKISLSGDFGFVSINYIFVFAFFILVNTIFVFLLKRPTTLGEELNAHTLGFKMFLEATEKDRMNFRNPPDKTPELFEKYLPYAVALGVEQQWGDQFSNILFQDSYQPNWYIGSSIAFNAAVFSNTISHSFVGAISGATMAPGGSSGFGSGGGSGGGGGGGGGGGW